MQYVSKADALGRFRREFAELASLTNDFDDNPFPASLEVRVRSDAQEDGRADALVRRVSALPGVADVRYDREWLARLASGLSAVRGVGFGLAVVMALAAAVTVASVVRLGLNARRGELEIMQLVGSPLGFIRGPFIAEGVMQGGFGALVALALLWMGLAVASGWWAERIKRNPRGQLAPVPAAPAVRGPGSRRHGGGRPGGLCGFPARDLEPG